MSLTYLMQHFLSVLVFLYISLYFIDIFISLFSGVYFFHSVHSLSQTLFLFVSYTGSSHTSNNSSNYFGSVDSSQKSLKAQRPGGGVSGSLELEESESLIKYVLQDPLWLLAANVDKDVMMTYQLPSR